MNQIDFKRIIDILEIDFKKESSPVKELIKVKANDKFRILVATILSARTKDKTTVDASLKLFSKVKNFRDLEKLTTKQIENLIYPVGFYKSKARHLKKLPNVLFSEFNGKIPNTLDGLIRLPGVGRKTANLVLATAFNQDAICVDVHVQRIVNRIGYVKTKNPLETEKALMSKTPKKYWKKINYVFVSHGQKVCTPVSPFCGKCKINALCKKVGVKKNR